MDRHKIVGAKHKAAFLEECCLKALNLIEEGDGAHPQWS